MNELMPILSDLPLDDISQDIFGYKIYAKKIVEDICAVPSESSPVFALYGPWGSGKTTCLNFVLHYINEKPKKERPIVVRFNPWWFSGREDLLMQFFKEFLIALSKNNVNKQILQTIAGFMDIISELPEPTGTLKSIGKLSSFILTQASKSKGTHELRADIKKKLKSYKGRIVVVVDDLDRLTSEEVKYLFMVIKSVIDFPNTVYLLAFDKEVIIKALEGIQSNNSAVTNISGEAYLEKIVQFHYALPTPSKSIIKKAFIHQVDFIFPDNERPKVDANYFWNVYFGGVEKFLNTMRNVKQLTNAIYLDYQSLKGEVNPVDLIAIETIKLFQPDLYNLIDNNQDMFCNESMSFLKDGLKSFHSAWFNKIPEKNKEPIKEILIKIFPQLDVSDTFPNGNYDYVKGVDSTWRRELRICHPQIFRIYFQIGVPEGELSNMEIQSVLALINDTAVFSRKLLELAEEKRQDGTTRLSALLERMSDYAEKEISVENIENIIKVFFDIGDKLLISSDESRIAFFTIDNEFRILRIVGQLINRLNTQDKRFEILKNAFSRGNAIYMITREVLDLGIMINKSKKEAELSLINEEQLNQLKLLVLEKIKNLAKTNTLLDVPKAILALYAWQTWEGEEPVREWVKSFIEPDENLVKFLLSCLGKTYTMSLANKVERSEWTINLKDIDTMIDTSKIVEKCRRLLNEASEWLVGNKKIAVQTFIKSYDLKEKGINPVV